MANTEQLELALKGPAIWNAWSEQNKGVGIDFSGINLDFDLSGFRFYGDLSLKSSTLRSPVLRDVFSTHDVDMTRLTIMGPEFPLLFVECHFRELKIGLRTGPHKLEVSNSHFDSILLGPGLNEVDFRESTIYRVRLTGSGLGDFRMKDCVCDSIFLEGAKAKIGHLIIERIDAEFISIDGSWPLNVVFKSVTAGDLSCRASEFRGLVLLKDCSLDRSDFEDAKFLRTTDFGTCYFDEAPRFHRADLHEETYFPPESFFGDRTLRAAPAYRTLKLMMEDKRARSAEGMFYALEKRSERNDLGLSSAERLFSYLYDLTSAYGQSLGRIMVCLFWVLSLSFLCYQAMFSYQPYETDKCVRFGTFCESNKQANQRALSFTIEQSVRPFSAWVTRNEDHIKSRFLSQSVDEVQANNRLMAIRLVSTLQAIVTTSLFGLLLLTLRWKFRRG